jgi:hypothetical protein
MRIHLDQPNQGEPVIKKIREAVLFDDCADQTILDEALLNNDDQNIIFFDGEVERLAPLGDVAQDTEGASGSINDDYTLYNILTLDFQGKDVYYVTPDFNIHSNLKRLKNTITKRKIEIKTDIIPLIDPYIFQFILSLFDSGWRDSGGKDKYINISIDNFTLGVNNTETKKSEIKTYDPKYKVVSLNCTRKDHRVKTIKALRGIEGFIYSYYPYEDQWQTDEFINEYEEEKELLNELTELNELYDHGLFMNKSEKLLKDRTESEIVNSFDSKREAFQQCVPLEYIQSYIDLVTESMVYDCVMLTEKTFKPISLKKPFILLSARNSHLFLKKMGYQLYDELFDYSFDDKNFSIRFKSIIKQIIYLLSLPMDVLQDKIEPLREKIEYNYKHMKTQKEMWTNFHKLNDVGYLQKVKERQNEFSTL